MRKMGRNEANARVGGKKTQTCKPSGGAYFKVLYKKIIPDVETSGDFG